MGKLLFCRYTCLSKAYKHIPSLTCIYGNHPTLKHLYTRTHTGDLMLLEPQLNLLSFVSDQRRPHCLNYTQEEHNYFIEIGFQASSLKCSIVWIKMYKVMWSKGQTFFPPEFRQRRMWLLNASKNCYFNVEGSCCILTEGKQETKHCGKVGIKSPETKWPSGQGPSLTAQKLANTVAEPIPSGGMIYTLCYWNVKCHSWEGTLLSILF